MSSFTAIEVYQVKKKKKNTGKTISSEIKTVFFNDFTNVLKVFKVLIVLYSAQGNLIVLLDLHES